MKRIRGILFSVFLSSQVMAEVDRRPYQSRVKKDHKVKLLNHGAHSFAKRFELIEKAKTSIDLEYFIFNADKAGRLLLLSLIEKAKTGVKVRILLDHFLTVSTVTPFMAHELKKVGIEVRYYNTVPMINIVDYQYRNHRKTFIIDGKEAITGGRNIGDEYFDIDEVYNFVDRDIYVEGPIVEMMQKSFDDYWNARPTKFVKRQRRPQYKDLKYQRLSRSMRGQEYEIDFKRWVYKVKEAQDFLKSNKDLVTLKNDIMKVSQSANSENEFHNCNDIAFYSDLPGVGPYSRKNYQILKNYLFHLISGAKIKVNIDSPYFIMNNFMGNYLKRALSKGIEVNLLTNGLYSTDAIYVQAVFNRDIKKWVRRGLKPRIYLGKAPSLYPQIDSIYEDALWGTHSKSFVIDDVVTMVGTFNLDPRSNNYNTEQALVCFNNKELAYELDANIEKRAEYSVLVDTPEKIDYYKFDKVSTMKRISYYILWGPSNIFDYLL